MKTGDKIRKEFYIENRLKYLTQLDNFSISINFAGEAPLKSGDAPYVFAPDRNFLYLTGIDKEKIIYFAYKTFGKIEEMLFIERSDEVKARWVGKSISAEEAREASGINKVLFLDEFETTLKSTIFTFKIQNIYLDLKNVFGKYNRSAALNFYEDFRKDYPGLKLKDGSKLVHKQRGVKHELELEQIKKAISITGIAVEHIINSVSPGMYEYQIESCFDFALKYHGVKERAFDSIIAGGVNATVLHYVDNNCQVGDDSLVLMDFGASWNYYSADITRTIPISGKFTERQKELYNMVLEGQLRAIESVKPGITIFDLNDALIEYYKTALKKVGLIGKKVRGEQLDKQLERYYWHKIGHSLGLDTHDCSPTRDMPLEPGMVFTIEPGIYVEEEGIGIRIEDDILVTENGCINLSSSIPKTVEEIEACFRELKKV